MPSPTLTQTAAPAIPPRLLAGMNPEQEQAVSTLRGPLLIVAGPGSGKTRVLTHRIAALLETGTAPGAVLAVTFTNKAAAEMRHRVGALIGESRVQRMWIATFHSACVRILRSHYEQVGLPRSFSIVDATDAQKLCAAAMDDLRELDPELTPADRKTMIKDTYRRISAAKNNDTRAEELVASANPDVSRAGRTMVAYNKALRARGAVDFDDILLLVLHLLRKFPHITAHYTARFSHVMVDEFQDTNAVQWEITRLLGGAGNVCVVGDADQSIYAFRGANPGVLDAFTRTFPGTQVVRLGRNYRSTKAIVAAAQGIIDQNPSEHRATMSTDNDQGEPVRVVALETDYDEARWVADQVRARGGDLGDHAVLVRTNSQTRALEAVMRERGIQHDVVGMTRFFDRAEIKDALAYLRIAVNPIDITALERAVATPRRGIGPGTLLPVVGPVLAGRATITAALADATASGGRGGAALGKFGVVLSQVEDAVLAGGPAAALEVVLAGGGMEAHYTPKVTGRDAEEGMARVENLRELLNSARDFVEGKAGMDPQGRTIADLDGIEQTEAFLEYAALMSSAEKPDDPATGELNKGAVQIATMHAAKGKEWKHVYVVGVEEGICPHARSQTTDEIAEERRLMFVAVSRAQQTLALTHVALRRTFKDEVAAERSRFVNDLPDSVEFEVVAPPRRFAPSAPGRTFGPGGGATWSPPAAAALRSPHSFGSRVSSAPPSRAATPGFHAAASKAAGPPRGSGLSAAQLPPGTRVSHPVFGSGTVLEVSASTVKVRFPLAVKVLATAHAPITIEQ